jgi:hypothetical protein
MAIHRVRQDTGARAGAPPDPSSEEEEEEEEELDDTDNANSKDDDDESSDGSSTSDSAEGSSDSGSEDDEEGSDDDDEEDEDSDEETSSDEEETEEEEEEASADVPDARPQRSPLDDLQLVYKISIDSGGGGGASVIRAFSSKPASRVHLAELRSMVVVRLPQQLQQILGQSAASSSAGPGKKKQQGRPAHSPPSICLDLR